MKTIIAGIMLLTLSGCHLTALESVLVGEVAAFTYDHTLATLPDVTPEQVEDVGKVVNPEREVGR